MLTNNHQLPQLCQLYSKKWKKEKINVLRMYPRMGESFIPSTQPINAVCRIECCNWCWVMRFLVIT